MSKFEKKQLKYDSLPSNTIMFYVNGKEHVIENPDPETSLIQYLRSTGLTGTKLGCAEGACSACTVMVSYYDTLSHRIANRAINSCLAPLCSVDGMSVITVEGIGSTRDIMHPIQKRLAEANGSQCGFCTPGFVMSLYALMRNHPNPTPKQILESLDGNLCRCTGYRPIYDAAKSFCCSSKDGKGCPCKDGSSNKVVEKQVKAESNHKHVERHIIFPHALKNIKPRELDISNHRGVNWIRPVSVDSLLALKKKYPKSKIVIGNTEIGVDIRLKYIKYHHFINTSRIHELHKITHDENGMTIGSSVTLTNMIEYMNKLIDTLPEHKTRALKATKKQ